MIACIFQRSVSMPAASAASSFCLIASSDRPKRERSIVQRDEHRDDQQHERDHDVDAVVRELHVRGRRLALHRQRHLLVAEPLEDVEQRERVGEHREREVVAAQPERRIADEQRRRRRRPACPSGMPNQGVTSSFTQEQRHRVRAEPEERRVAERDQARVAAEARSTRGPSPPRSGPASA